MANSLKYVPVGLVDPGKRFREDLGDIAGLVESVKEKGVLQPITITTDGTLIAGGRRLKAAIEAGLETIPALIRDQTETEDAEVDLREIELIENTFRKDFTWQEQVNLIAEIDRLCREKNKGDWSARKTAQILGHSHPMNVSRALNLAEAMEVFPELAKCKTQDDAQKFVKKAEEAIINKELIRRQENIKDQGLRDVLELAKHNYQIGDALQEMRDLGPVCGIHFIEVDPPYGIELNDVKKGHSADTYKEVPTDEYGAFLKEVAELTYKVAAYSNCWMVFWFGPTHHQLVLTSLRAAGWEVDDIPGIWNKGHGQTMQPNIYLGRSYEPFFICRKGRPALAKQGRSNVFDYPPVAPSSKYHPTERPVALIEELIMTFSGLNSLVFVPFLGSGATLRAVYNTGSTGWGYDLNPEYKDKFLLAVERDTKNLQKDGE